MAVDGVSPSDEVEMSEKGLQAVLEDLSARSETWAVQVAPLGDEMGFRAVMLVADSDVILGACSSADVIYAVTTAISRGLENIEDMIAEAKLEEEGLTE